MNESHLYWCIHLLLSDVFLWESHRFLVGHINDLERIDLNSILTSQTGIFSLVESIIPNLFYYKHMCIIFAVTLCCQSCVCAVAFPVPFDLLGFFFFKICHFLMFSVHACFVTWWAFLINITPCIEKKLLMSFQSHERQFFCALISVVPSGH